MKPIKVLATVIIFFAFFTPAGLWAKTADASQVSPSETPPVETAAAAPAPEAEAAQPAPSASEAVPPASEEDNQTPASLQAPTGEAAQPATCSSSCESYCSCWNKKGGGGPVMLLIFNRYNSAKYGDFSGPTLWYGGRGYGYIYNNRIRLGGMGAGGAGPADDSNVRSRGSDAIYYPYSTSRRVGGGYGGFTAEYVFSREIGRASCRERV